MPLLTPGEKLGPYEILNPLGAGGMGEVWKARDTRLNRFVAIKKGNDQFSDRFAREAQAIAALNHPHICQIYDVGPDFLVMEYIEGQPLVSPERPGPLPVAQALDYAGQICDALDAAHRKGITHRDLKPGNILVGKAGVKILDFGLAKMESAAAKPDDATMTRALTGVGMIVGTPQYMAPEQFEGREADARSDIFSFGLVLYEMLSGKRAFSGATHASLIASVLKDQPLSLRELQPLVSAPLEGVVRTCLEKDPDKRWQSAREVKHALEWISGASAAAPQAAPAQAPPADLPAPAPAKRSRLWPALAAALAIALGIALWTLWPKPAPPAHAVRFQIKLPDGVSFNQFVSLSPDGRKLVFNATGDQGGLWIHDLETLEWQRLAGTEGGQSPFWSPDSRFLGFGAGHELKKIEVTGGPVQTLCSVDGVVGSGAWNRDGAIVFGMRTGALHRVSSAGGAPADVTVLDSSRGETFHSLPTFLPDGKHFVYLRQGLPGIAGIYAGSLDIKPAEQSKERILENSFAAPYVDGNLFFMRAGTLMLQPFDAAKLQLRGEAVPVAEHVGTTGATGIFSISTTGVLAYRAGSAVEDRSQATWFDRQGKVLGTFGERSSDRRFVLSPDGMSAAVRDAADTARGDIWRLDFARGVRSRVTFHQSAGSVPVWSADGSRMIFATGAALDTLYEKSSSGAGEETEVLKQPGELMYPSSWSRDGRFLLFEKDLVPKTGVDLWVLPLDGDRKPVPLLATEFVEGAGVFSPDMRWIAYVSGESGRVEIYVRPFNPSGPSLGEGKWQVSKDGGTGLPHWRADGKELIFKTLNGAPMAVDVSANGAVFVPGIPKQLFPAPAGLATVWDVTSDGKRFLMGIAPVQAPVDEPITVVLNWPAALKR